MGIKVGNARFELTLFSGGGVGLAVGPADRKDELHRHVADYAGDRRRSFACDAVLAELVGGELAGSRIVAYLIGADDEGAAVLVADDERFGASRHGTDTIRKGLAHACETPGITAATANGSPLGLLLFRGGVREKLRHG